MSSPALAAKPAFRGRRLLLALGGFLVVEALAVGSGAYFVSSSVSAATGYATGALTESDSEAEEAILTLENLTPGDVLGGAVTITNTEPAASAFALQEDALNGFADRDALTLTVTEQGATTPIWSGTFGELDSIDLGTFDAEESRTFLFSTILAPTAGDEAQGKTASAVYSWSAVQTPPTPTTQ